jgi:GNAT superfamily N-acetyltransferase
MTQPAPVSVRRAEPRDLPALGRLGALLMRTHYALDRNRFLEPGVDAEGGYARFLGTQLECEDASVFVAERDGDLLGYVYASVEPMSWKELRDEAGFIDDVVIDERARREGVARTLVEAATAWLFARGVPRVMLWTAERNQAARQLFTALGFRPTMIEMTRERPR